MKRAIVTAAALTVQCPSCKEPQPEPASGSHVWETTWEFPKTVRCGDCGTEFSVVIPKSIKIN
jgi:uncharacterized Zn finger protein